MDKGCRTKWFCGRQAISGVAQLDRRWVQWSDNEGAIVV